MNPLTATRKALQARLETIVPANGYTTAAGQSVKAGWADELISAEDAIYPMLIIQPAKGAPPVAGAGALKVGQGFNIIGAVQASGDYQDALDELLADILCCLTPGLQRTNKWLPVSVVGLTLGAPNAFPPGSGLSAATVVVPITIQTVINAHQPA